ARAPELHLGDHPRACRAAQRGEHGRPPILASVDALSRIEEHAVSPAARALARLALEDPAQVIGAHRSPHPIQRASRRAAAPPSIAAAARSAASRRSPAAPDATSAAAALITTA